MQGVNNNGEALKAVLAVAVPLWIEQLRPLGLHLIYERIAELRELRDASGMLVIGSEAVLTKEGFKPGATAAAFNATAEAIACMAFAPGGIKIFGQHWDATHLCGTGPLVKENR